MTRTRTTVLSGTVFLLAAAVALTLVFLAGRSSGGTKVLRLGAGSAGLLNKEGTAGEGPASGFEAYRSAARTYPANTISPAIVARAIRPLAPSGCRAPSRAPTQRATGHE